MKEMLTNIMGKKPSDHFSARLSQARVFTELKKACNAPSTTARNRAVHGGQYCYAVDPVEVDERHTLIMRVNMCHLADK